jgi:FMN phosphatase YigB (HAD superfamily)
MTHTNHLDHTALVFDWGDTLMRVFPHYTGPMVDWPQVEEIAGVKQSLEQLYGHYQMVVATNAADSGAAKVQQALDRVNLGSYFKAVFTAQELGSQKPELGFYRQIESVLARSPHEMVMIGDSYPVDILGAKIAGWRTVWYNPENICAPGSLPLHDMEVQSMEELPLVIQDADCLIIRFVWPG